MKKIETKNLENITNHLMKPGKGILAADESIRTAGKRLADIGLENTVENRRKYKELFLNSHEIEKYLSGVILYDETFLQKNDNGQTFAEALLSRNIYPGIKLDMGVMNFPASDSELYTKGLDDLPERIQKYSNTAKFAKWRVVVKIDSENGLPSENALNVNLSNLAQYARICQENGIVPIVEPEVLLRGNHTIEESEIITTKVLQKLFSYLQTFKVYVPGLILKTSMVISGNENIYESSSKKVAEYTVRTLKNSVPKDIGGVVFLSGGQMPVEATEHFDKIVEEGNLNFEITFSFARAIQQNSIKIWSGKDKNIKFAREEFLKRLELNILADSGDYEIGMEFEK